MSLLDTIIGFFGDLGISSAQTWVEGRARTSRGDFPLFFHNTLGNVMQEFTLPSNAHTVRMYNCGPTVYGRQHIGNVSMFVFTDLLRRALEYNDYAVKQVINITDFGHLASDADEGEDKMTKGLKREGMEITLENMRTLAEKYTRIFLEDMRALNIDPERIEFPRASEHIPGQIAMIKALEEKGYAYRGAHGVYFDTARFPSYGALGNIDIASLKAGARVKKTEEKRSPTDFLLWKADKKIGWNSPWGKGFPGWHIECSAMIRATLGQQIDIHTGGIEHIPVHHNNEIAQSESAVGKHPLSRFWLHRAHIQIEGGKIAKSEGNVIYMSDIVERGFHPLALRYLFLGAHYRTPLNFSFDALAASQHAYARLLATVLSLKDEGGQPDPALQKKFHERINDDLDTPGALAVLWETRSAELEPSTLRATLLDFDRVLGLSLSHPDTEAVALAQKETRVYLSDEQLSSEALSILERREKARIDRNWIEADALRDELEVLGFGVDDSPEGARVHRKG
ncbi:cysteine--tRNA ligase [Candidatus Kaiserbacteria bacterium]|nr:cysteine--tRNA ligase [Candidatus Kaiserbacteria bacterium]